MTIAIADWQRFGHRPAHAADAVRAKLSALDSGDTHVLESVPLSTAGCEIDHLIISRAGVFTVSVHEEQGRNLHVDHYGLAIDGVSVPYLRRAKFEAEQISRLLCDHLGFDVPVHGCIVVLTGSHEPHIHYENRPSGVSVLVKSDVPRWFRRQPLALEAGQILATYATALKLPTFA